MSNMNMQAPWGTYAPPPGRILRAIVTFGLAHGFIRKKIIASWKRQYGAITDIETRGIKYRLNILDNADSKTKRNSTGKKKGEMDYHPAFHQLRGGLPMSHLAQAERYYIFYMLQLARKTHQGGRKGLLPVA